jgi:hypothetical protein
MKLRTLTRTLGAAVVAGSLTVASIGVANAEDQAPSDSSGRPSAVAEVVARGDFAIDRRLRSLDELTGVVQSDGGLTPGHRDTVGAQLQADATALRELRTRIDTAPTKATAQRGFERIKHFHIYNLVVPKVQLLLASDGMGGAALNLHLSLGQVLDLLPAAQQQADTPAPATEPPATTPSTEPPATTPSTEPPTTTPSTEPPTTTSTTAPASATTCQRDQRDCVPATTPSTEKPAPKPNGDEVSNATGDAAEADVTATEVKDKTEKVSDTVVGLSAKDFEAARAQLLKEREKLADLRAELERVSDVLQRVDVLLQRLQEALAAFMAPPAPTPPTKAPTTTAPAGAS